MTYHFNLPVRITKEYLLNKNSEENYFEYYLHIPVTGKMFSSPLRKDKNPSCKFFRSRSGHLIYKDFAGLSFDFIGCVMELYNITYNEALERIASDFGYINPQEKKEVILHDYKVKELKKAEIDIIQKNFSNSDLEYWNQYGISLDTLHHYNVYSVMHVYVNKKYYKTSTDRNPIFAYKLDGWKVYFPGQKTKFIGNAKKIQGLDQLGNSGFLLITKSMKDVMVLYSMGIDAIAPHSECVALKKKEVMSYGRITTVMYDNDLAGIRGVQKYKNYAQIVIIKRKYGKDISDFIKFNTDDFVEAIHDLKEIIRRERTKSKYFYVFK